ncbi:MAG: nuclear transport factor 2 family protein [Burkholderiales bacterium]|nr:nuclear transport factor 2 family protein [Burkholderiales bacterium]
MNDGSAEREVVAADDERNRAMIEADYETLDRLLGEGLVYTHGNATSDGKARYMENLRSGKVRYLWTQRDKVCVRVYGETAVMHGDVVLRSRRDGVERTLSNAFMTVWVKGPGGWQMVAWASTPKPGA